MTTPVLCLYCNHPLAMHNAFTCNVNGCFCPPLWDDDHDTGLPADVQGHGVAMAFNFDAELLHGDKVAQGRGIVRAKVGAVRGQKAERSGAQ